MELIRDGLLAALTLLLRGDPELWGIAARTVLISGGATLVSVALGVPAGLLVALGRVPGRRFVLALLFTGMGLPTVLVGLVLTVLLWREGPLGGLRLLYTPTAVLIGQAIIAFPVIAGLTAAAVQSIDPRVRLQVEALGATPVQAARLLAGEARRGVLAACMAGFGAAVAEVGAAMMLGGNLSGSTRVLTTATITEARMGRFDRAIGLGAILLAIAFLVNVSLTVLQPRTRR